MWCGGDPDIVALQGKAAFDASCQIKLGKDFVYTPQATLKCGGLCPTSGDRKVIKLNACPWQDARRSSHPSQSPHHHNRGRDMRRRGEHAEIWTTVDNR